MAWEYKQVGSILLYVPHFTEEMVSFESAVGRG